MKNGAKQQTLVRIGELLVAAGIMDSQAVTEALHLAKKTGSPVGRIMQMAGDLKERDLQNALAAQTMVREGQLTVELATAVLNTAFTEHITLEEALPKHGWQNREEKNLSEIAELLIASGLFQDEVMQKAIERTERTNQPLGSTLLAMGAISPALLASALTALFLIRNGQVTHEDAVRALRMSFTKEISIEQAFVLERIYVPPKQNSIRLGELLGMAGLVAESDSLSAIETGLLNHKPLGRVLTESGLVPLHLVDAALELQQMASLGTIDSRQASEILCSIQKTGSTVQEAISRKKQKGDLAADLLKIAGLVTDSDLERAQSFASGASLDTARSLFDAFIIDQMTYSAASRCIDLIEQNMLEVEDAIVLLQHCAQKRVSVEQALQAQVWRLTRAQPPVANATPKVYEESVSTPETEKQGA